MENILLKRGEKSDIKIKSGVKHIMTLKRKKVLSKYKPFYVYV